MSRIAYVNGRYVPHRAARVHVEDRGYQFADGVYEVWFILNGRLLDEEGHLTRLQRSLNELQIAAPMSLAALRFVLRETARRNKVRNGVVYLQITRGVAPRDHVFPKDVAPSIVVTSRSVDMEAISAKSARGVAVISRPDERWARPDIKTVGLLANALGKQAAAESGAQEVWFVDHAGHVTEGGSTNAWIVDAEGRLVTRQADNGILNGITRRTVKRLAEERQIAVVERPFTVEEAQAAQEAFMTSATSFVMPVIKIDGVEISGGRPGPVAQRLRKTYMEIAQAEAGSPISA
ncbi:MAG: D-amino-acid transaminase [Parvularculaceae bacterium]